MAHTGRQMKFIAASVSVLNHRMKLSIWLKLLFWFYLSERKYRTTSRVAMIVAMQKQIFGVSICFVEFISHNEPGMKFIAASVMCLFTQDYAELSRFIIKK